MRTEWRHLRMERAANNGYGKVIGRVGNGSGTRGSTGRSARKLAVVVSRVTLRPGRRFAFTVRFKKGSGRVSVVARRGHATRRLRAIKKVGAGRYTVTATLLRGTWTLSIRITPAQGYSRAKLFNVKVKVH